MKENIKRKELLESIIEYTNSKEQRRFKIKSLFNYHLDLHQDFNGIEFKIGFSVSEADEYNCIFYVSILFWGICFSWNGRNIFNRPNKNN